MHITLVLLNVPSLVFFKHELPITAATNADWAELWVYLEAHFAHALNALKK